MGPMCYLALYYYGPIRTTNCMYLVLVGPRFSTVIRLRQVEPTTQNSPGTIFLLPTALYVLASLGGRTGRVRSKGWKCVVFDRFNRFLHCICFAGFFLHPPHLNLSIYVSFFSIYRKMSSLTNSTDCVDKKPMSIYSFERAIRFEVGSWTPYHQGNCQKCLRVGHIGWFCIPCRQIITRVCMEGFFLNPHYVATDWQPLSSRSIQLETACVENIIAQFPIEDTCFKLQRKVSTFELETTHLQMSDKGFRPSKYVVNREDRIRYWVCYHIMNNEWSLIKNESADYLDQWTDRSELG